MGSGGGGAFSGPVDHAAGTSPDADAAIGRVPLIMVSMYSVGVKKTQPFDLRKATIFRKPFQRVSFQLLG